MIIFLPAYGHKPISSSGENLTYENSLQIPDHKISWFVYEELKPYQTKFYTFDAKQGDDFYASIVIPKLDRLEKYSPSLALIGQGIQISNFNEIDSELPEGGVVVYNYDGAIPSKEFYEPFGQATYWDRQEIRISIPQDGVYYAAVFDTQGMNGKYSIAIGTIEDFSFIDFFTILPTAWVDTKLFFEDYASLAIFFSILFGIPGIVILSVIKKRRLMASANL